MTKKNIVVYCGCHPGNNSVFSKVAEDVGTLIAKKGHNLIYGGGKSGLMGIVADSAMKSKGFVTGVIPEVFVKKEQAHYELQKLFIVKNLSQRKEYFLKHGDIFIILPGGLGTLEELADTASYIRTYKDCLENYPIYVLNINGFYDPLLKLFETYTQYSFIPRNEWANIIFCNSVEELNIHISKFENN